MNEHPPDPPTSSVHPVSGAPDRVALAEFHAGLPDEPGTAAIAAHVQECADCQAVLSGLRATSADLQQLGSTPMPAAVADRIAAALAAEPRVPGSVESREGRHRAAQVVERRPSRDLGWLRAAAGLAAGIVLLGGGGYLLIDAAGGGEDAATMADSGGGGDEAAPQGESAEGVLPSFDRQSLEAAAGALLEDNPLPRAQTTDDAEGAATDVDVSQDCLASIPVATAQALSVTRALYQGQPAIIVIFADSPGRVAVTVFSDCAEGAPPEVIDSFPADR